MECADLVEFREKYFEEMSLCSLFLNVNPETMFNYLKEIGMFYEVCRVSDRLIRDCFQP